MTIVNVDYEYIFGHVCFIENIRGWEIILSTILEENIIDESFVIKVMNRHFSRVNEYNKVQIFGSKEIEIRISEEYKHVLR